MENKRNYTLLAEFLENFEQRLKEQQEQLDAQEERLRQLELQLDEDSEDESSITEGDETPIEAQRPCWEWMWKAIKNKSD